MMLLDGKKIADAILDEVRCDLAEFVETGWRRPCLAAILAGDDAASAVYVGRKEAACERVGIESRIIRLPETSTEELLALIATLNADTSVSGILVQLPLPRGCNTKQILDAIDPAKDVDAFHPINMGLLAQGRPRYLPCTPAGIRELLDRYNIETAGKHVVIVGRSDIVGKPMSMLLLDKSPQGNATVTTVHSHTKDIAALTRLADILIVAMGRPRFVTGDMVRDGAVVIDVGINRLADGKLCGDVDFDSVAPKASAITPVPGGVGPLTIAMLLQNTFKAAMAWSTQPKRPRRRATDFVDVTE
ncbi:MAG: bifunctional methylenetetrahydrofolate dehydrogenase/methenyltetrahydrofolate cyclohydrolase FolD [Thermoguttaceae bacterium]